MHTRLFAFVLVLVMLCSVGLPGGASPQNLPVSDPQVGQEREKDPQAEALHRRQEKALNESRHNALKKDTDKLLELATELKMYVDKSNEHTLSLDVVRKAEAIEKLARSVKEKMRGM